MTNSTHAGELIRAKLIDELNMSVGDAAKALGMSRPAFSRVINSKAAVSTDFALRLERAGLGTANKWLEIQANYDLAQARKNPPNVKVLLPAPVSDARFA